MNRVRTQRALLALTSHCFLVAAFAQGYPNPDLLVDPSWLSSHLTDPTIFVVDMRERAGYRESHVPGAVNLPVDDVVATVEGVPFELDETSLQTALRAIGLDSDHTVVIYDDLGMMNAARLFWTLEYVGHEDVRILDGGWNAWVEYEGPIEAGQVEREPSQYTLTLEHDKVISADELASRLGEPNLTVADARSREEFTGEVRYGARGGRIPSAVHLPWFGALTGGDTIPTTQPGWPVELTDPDVEHMKVASELNAWLTAAGVTPHKEIVTYCQTFWRGAHLYFVLRLTGFENVRGYDGSWAEWGNRLELPIESGEPR